MFSPQKDNRIRIFERMLTILRHILSIFFLLASITVSYAMSGSITSTGNGDWNTSTTWSDANDPSCTVTDDYTIQSGDSIWCVCDTLEIAGNGGITIESGGVLYISGAGGLNGNGDLTIESGAKLIVDGDLAVSGNGDLVLEGSMEVGGDFTVAGAGSTSGTGTLTITGAGCDEWEGLGPCTEGFPLSIDLVSFEAHLNIDQVDIKIWPTPNDGTHINIEMSGYDPSHEVLVIVRDIAGREYYSKVLITDMDGHLISAIDPANRLPVGTYLITGSDQNHLYSKRLIVK